VLPGGEAVVDQRFAYSADTPRIEVIQAVPGTVWVPAPGSGIHHVGYWSDDVAGDAARLERHGLAREAAGVRPGGEVFWTYHRAAGGPRIELVSRDLLGPLSEYWSTGSSS
jgi:hypothetical protein